MEREPDYNQYWQPESQPAEGYYGEQPQQQPAYGQVDYNQSGYPSEPYQQDPNPTYEQDPESAYQQQYSYSGYEYTEQQPYTPDQYGGPGYGESMDSTAQWSVSDFSAEDPQQAPRSEVQSDPQSQSETPATPETAAFGASGSSAIGAATGGRASRRAAARGRTPAAADGSAQPAGSRLARLAAAATGRAPGTDRRTFLLRAGLGGLALVVLAGAGYAVMGQGSGSSKTSSSDSSAATANLTAGHTKLWAAPADAGSANDNDGLIGSWLLSTAVVRGDGTGVTAYNSSTGAKLWTLTPPTAGAVPCGMSPTVSSTGIGAVLFQAKPGTGQACTQLVAVDTTTGKQDWTAKISATASAYGASVMVNDTTAAAVGDSGAIGYNLSTGKQSWTYTGPGKYCALSGDGTGQTLLLQSTCADTSPKQQVISLNAGTGKLVWWRGLPATAASYTVLSATPAVVAVHMADSSQDTLLSFSTTGTLQPTIPVAQVGGRLDSVHGSFDPVPALFFQGTTLLAELTPTTTGSSASPGTAVGGTVTAIDLLTGKQLWQAAPQEKGQSALVGLDGTAAVLATEEQIGQLARLSHFDLATGKEAAGGSFPQGTGSLLTSGRVLYQSNLVVSLPEFTSTYNSAATAFSAATSG